MFSCCDLNGLKLVAFVRFPAVLLATLGSNKRSIMQHPIELFIVPSNLNYNLRFRLFQIHGRPGTVKQSRINSNHVVRVKNVVTVGKRKP